MGCGCAGGTQSGPREGLEGDVAELARERAGGAGVLRVANGDVYEGEFKEGVANGLGIRHYTASDAICATMLAVQPALHCWRRKNPAAESMRTTEPFHAPILSSADDFLRRGKRGHRPAQAALNLTGPAPCSPSTCARSVWGMRRGREGWATSCRSPRTATAVQLT